MIKRLLMTADTVGGVWTYSIDLATALSQHGVEVVLATVGAPVSEAQLSEAKRIPNVKLEESSFKLEWMDDPWEDVEKAGEWLLELERRYQPELIHLNAFAHGRVPFKGPKLVVCHSCVLSWYQAVKGEDAPDEWSRYEKHVRAGLHSAQAVVAPSNEMLRSIQELYGPLPEAEMIPNGRQSGYYMSLNKKQFILTAGRFWDEAKNIQTLERAAPNVKWPVYVAGETNAVKPGSGVLALGRLGTHELAGWFSHASIYALPARYEPFGLSILEAAMSGCALVLGDIPSLRENWDGAALFVQPNDEEALASALNTLCDNEELRLALAKEAQRRSRNFSLDKTFKSYMDLYERMLEKAGTEATVQ